MDWTAEANRNTVGPVVLRVHRAPPGSVTYSATAVTLTIAAGTRSATSAAVLPVSRGDRLLVVSSAAYNHDGLTVRGRLQP
ncbi:hypothetical protein [Haliangium sp. UPWRP_2]|uniref:hypothetical protein n=1 Tax=Haliangium sp. UPWRP_2 TaxID=1931276 RepID=UPI001E4EEC1B|nr:hypothetical protein [Haliangium sp. UPWRP_2]